MKFYINKQVREKARWKKIKDSISTESADFIFDSARKAADDDTFDVFLSHSMKDADLVLGVASVLEEKGKKSILIGNMTRNFPEIA